MSEQEQAPKPVEEASLFFRAGQDAKRRGQKLTESALRSLRPGCRQYDEFIAGYDSAGKP